MDEQHYLSRRPGRGGGGDTFVPRPSLTAIINLDEGRPGAAPLRMPSDIGTAAIPLER